MNTRTNALGVVESDALCRLDEKPSVSHSLMPLCHQGWRLASISPDHHSVIADCSEENSFLDTLYYISRTDVEVVDTSTLQPIAYLKLPTRSLTTEAVFHANGRTILATIKEGEILKLYTIPDLPEH